VRLPGRGNPTLRTSNPRCSPGRAFDKQPRTSTTRFPGVERLANAVCLALTGEPGHHGARRSSHHRRLEQLTRGGDHKIAAAAKTATLVQRRQDRDDQLRRTASTRWTCASSHNADPRDASLYLIGGEPLIIDEVSSRCRPTGCRAGSRSSGRSSSSPSRRRRRATWWRSCSTPGRTTRSLPLQSRHGGRPALRLAALPSRRSPRRSSRCWAVPSPTALIPAASPTQARREPHARLIPPWERESGRVRFGRQHPLWLRCTASHRGCLGLGPRLASVKQPG